MSSLTVKHIVDALEAMKHAMRVLETEKATASERGRAIGLLEGSVIILECSSGINRMRVEVREEVTQ